MIRWLLRFPVALSLFAGAAAAETVTYIHTDQLGSPVLETNSAAANVRAADYRAYGDELLSGPQLGPAFTGHYRDADTGLVYMQQRYFDPLVGRFLSVDAVAANEKPGQNFNRYWYGNNNPYTLVDPDGRQSKATSKEMGRWIRAMWDNGGDFKKAEKQIQKVHEGDKKMLGLMIEFSAVGPVKDAVEVWTMVYENKDPTGKGTGAIVGEAASLATEKYLDGKIGKAPANWAGSLVGKLVGDAIESEVNKARGGAVPNSPSVGQSPPAPQLKPQEPKDLSGKGSP